MSVELEIDALAAGGDGVGRLGGRAIFVPGAAPGDRLRVRIVREQRRYARAEIEQVLAAGPGRQPPSCPYADRCGGYDWLHLDAATQRTAREAILRDALHRIAGRRRLPPIEYIESPRALGYRARARVAYAEGRVGFRAARSHDVVDIERCAVLEPATQRALEALRQHPPRGRGQIEIRGDDKGLYLGGRWLQVSSGSFFQANAMLWEAWVGCVRGVCGRGDFALELYAGVGFFTLGLVAAFRRVIAVESSRAVDDLRCNAAAEVVRAAAEDWLPAQVGRLRPDLLLMNPPRVGCEARVIDAVSRLRPARVVYVSCEPATLARDAARLGAAFELRKLVLLDALPQTHHVEAIAVFEPVDSVSAAD